MTRLALANYLLVIDANGLFPSSRASVTRTAFVSRIRMIGRLRFVLQVATLAGSHCFGMVHGLYRAPCLHRMARFTYPPRLDVRVDIHPLGQRAVVAN